MTTFCATTQTYLKSTQMQKSTQPSSLRASTSFIPNSQKPRPQLIKAQKIKLVPRRTEVASISGYPKQSHTIPNGRQSFTNDEEVAVKSSEESQRPDNEQNNISLTLNKEANVLKNKSPLKFNLNISEQVQKESGFSVLYNRKRAQRPEEPCVTGQGELEGPSKKDDLDNLSLKLDLEAGPSINAVETPQRPILIDVEGFNAQERVEVASNNQSDVPRQTIDRENLLDIDAKLYLRQICFSFMFLILASIVASFMIIKDISSHRWLFIVLYCYFGYLAIEKIIRLRSPEVHDWKQVERLFDLFEICAFLIFQGLLDLDLSSPSMCFPFPLVLVAVVYCFASQAPVSVKSTKILTRAAYCIQAFLIMAKLNGILQLEWRIIFVFLWIYFVVLAISSVLIALTAVTLIVCSIFKVDSISVPCSRDRIIGLIWYTVYYGLGIVGFMGLERICEVLDENKRAELLGSTLSLVSLICSVLLFFTVLMFNRLKKFVKMFDQLRNFSGTGIDLADTKLEIKKHVLDFKIDKNLQYFAKVSSTYFKPIDRNKRKIMRLADENTQKAVMKDKSGVIESLKQDKQILDSKLKVIPLPFIKTQEKVTKVPLVLSFDIKSVNRNVEVNEDQEGSQCPKHAVYQFQDRKFFTAGSISEYKETETGNAAKQEEGLCYVCVEREANAILMDCGHGGICYDCAVSMICQKNECMECRKPVKTIYKIISNSKGAEVLTGILEAKVVEF